MEVRCPACGTVNTNQRFCGNCGKQLLFLETELKTEPKTETMPEIMPTDKDKTPYKQKVIFGSEKSIKVIDYIISFVYGAILLMVLFKFLAVGALHLFPIMTNLLLFHRTYFFISAVFIFIFL